jgi:hypothetical protein
MPDEDEKRQSGSLKSFLSKGLQGPACIDETMGITLEAPADARS